MKSIKRMQRTDEGFTLIELLIAIVVVGVLTAVAIVGIQGLTNNGEKSACQATKDAAKAAVAVHYSNNAGAFPTDFATMVTAKELEVAGGVTVANGAGTNDRLNGTNWQVDLGAAGVVTSTGC